MLTVVTISGEILTIENQTFSSSSSQCRHSKWSNYLN